jgi:hypothetical protein
MFGDEIDYKLGATRADRSSAGREVEEAIVTVEG